MNFSDCHCMQCGHKPMQFSHDKQWRCLQCGFEYFHNVAAAVGALLLFDGRYLLLRRARQPGAGRLDVVGGFIDPGESAQQALEREIQEELGVKLAGTLNLIGTWPNQYRYKDVEYRTLDIFYLLQLTALPELSACADEVSELVWLSHEQLGSADMAFSSAAAMLSHYLNHP